MYKHRKQRVIKRKCLECTESFVTASSIKFYCGPICRVKTVSRNFSSIEECWNWPRSRNPVSGYGQLSEWRCGKRYLLTAHVVSHQAFIGETKGIHVCHKCDNPACFNPAHLFLGTVKDNMLDCSRKGRINPSRGELSGRARLTEEKVMFLRSSSLTTAQLARALGMPYATVQSARVGRTWRHLPNSKASQCRPLSS